MHRRLKWALLAIAFVTAASATLLYPPRHSLTYDHAAVVRWCGDPHRPKIPALINGDPFSLILDTGNSWEFILPIDILSSVGISAAPYEGPWATITGDNPTGRITNAFTCTIGSVSETIPSAMATDSHEILVGAPWFRRKGAIIDCGKELIAWDAMENGSGTLDNRMCRNLFDHGFLKIPFQSDTSVGMLVTVTINSVALSLIVDTGAVRSFLDRKMAQQLRIIDPNAPIKGTMTGTRKEEKDIAIEQSLPIRMSIGRIEYPTKLWIYSYEALNKAIADRSPTRGTTSPPHIDGTIGMDFLLAQHAIIDPGNNVMYVRP